MRRILFIILSALFIIDVFAQEQATDTLEIYFHQSSSLWDPMYKNNGERLDAFVDRFRKLREDEEMKRISKIHIIAGCSPEGYWSYNQQLSKDRARSIRKVLQGYITLPDSIIVEKAIGINWEGLRKMVEADPNVPHREEVLDIIDNSPELGINYEGKELELRKVRLMWRFNGEAWRYIYDKFFPTLRSFNLKIVIEWELHNPENKHLSEAIMGGGKTH